MPYEEMMTNSQARQRDIVLAPNALAGEDESASDVVNKLLRGTSLEGIVEGININAKN